MPPDFRVASKDIVSPHPLKEVVFFLVVADGWNRAIKEAAPQEIKDLVITSDSLKKEFGKPMDVIADDLFGPIDAKSKAKLLELCCKYEHEAIIANTKDITFSGVRETRSSATEPGIQND